MLEERNLRASKAVLMNVAVDKLLCLDVGAGGLALVLGLLDTGDKDNLALCVSLGLELVARPRFHIVEDTWSLSAEMAPREALC